VTVGVMNLEQAVKLTALEGRRVHDLLRKLFDACMQTKRNAGQSITVKMLGHVTYNRHCGTFEPSIQELRRWQLNRGHDNGIQDQTGTARIANPVAKDKHSNVPRMLMEIASAAAAAADALGQGSASAASSKACQTENSEP